jgi:hypothetical protein
MDVFQAAGYSCSIKHVPTSDGTRRADLHVISTRLMGKDDLMVDYTLRHDFIGDARTMLRHGALRNPDRPDQILLTKLLLTRSAPIGSRTTAIGHWRFCPRFGNRETADGTRLFCQ